MVEDIPRRVARAHRRPEGVAQGHGPMNDTVTESDTGIERQATDLVFEYDLDAPPEKVWRAISIPALRDRWLPKGDLAQAEPVASKPGEEIAYAMRDDAPPFLE